MQANFTLSLSVIFLYTFYFLENVLCLKKKAIYYSSKLLSNLLHILCKQTFQKCIFRQHAGLVRDH